MMIKITQGQHREIQACINEFGADLKDVKSSIPYTAPELMNHRWQQISNSAVALVVHVLQVLGVEEEEFEETEGGTTVVVS